MCAEIRDVMILHCPVAMIAADSATVSWGHQKFLHEW
jgi:hypothetical protein